MSERVNIGSGAPWEARVGYSRAVRLGAHVAVTGTVAMRDGQVVGEDAYAQAREALAIVTRALEDAGAAPSDVVRTRIYVTDIAGQWEDVGRAHAEVFGDIRPATTMVEVSRLIVPEALVEIEADAIVTGA